MRGGGGGAHSLRSSHRESPRLNTAGACQGGVYCDCSNVRTAWTIAETVTHCGGSAIFATERGGKPFLAPFLPDATAAEAAQSSGRLLPCAIVYGKPTGGLCVRRHISRIDNRRQYFSGNFRSVSHRSQRFPIHWIGLDAPRQTPRWTHMGRVNSLRRIRYAKSIGCDSVDGSALAMFTDTYLEGYCAAASAPAQLNLLY